MNKMYDEIANTLLTSDRYAKDGELRQLHIVDLGTIMTSKDGFATVRAFSQLNGKVLEYPNVELLYIGSIGGGLDVVPTGSLCLLLRTATPVLNTRDESIVPNERPYMSGGLKAIPLSNCFGADVHMGFDESGAFLIYTNSGISLSLSNKQWSFGIKGSTLLCISDDGSIVQMNKDRYYTIQQDKEISIIYYEPSTGTPVSKLVISDSVEYFMYQAGNWVSVAKTSTSETIIKYGSNTKLEINSTGVTINNHLKVT